MSEYVTKGARMQCTCGAAPSQLQVTSNTLLLVQGNVVATTTDKAPMVNIMPFGTCTMKPSISGFLPCVPSPTMWTGFLASVQIPGGNPLLKTSTIQCALGGVISFQNSGQMKPQKVVLNPSSPQIDALKKAAINATPFCEECQRKESELMNTNIKPEIVEVFWINEIGREDVGKLSPGQYVTLCVEVINAKVGDTVEVIITNDQGLLYKGGQEQLKYTPKIESDNIAYIENFTIEYEAENE